MLDSELKYAALAELLPHGDLMCLIAQVQQFDQTHLLCSAIAPLQNTCIAAYDGRVSLFAGIELAAQAAALHVALLLQNQEKEEKEEKQEEEKQKREPKFGENLQPEAGAEKSQLRPRAVMSQTTKVLGAVRNLRFADAQIDLASYTCPLIISVDVSLFNATTVIYDFSLTAKLTAKMAAKLTAKKDDLLNDELLSGKITLIEGPAKIFA